MAESSRGHGPHTTHEPAIVHRPEVAANVMICLIHQTNYLLDRQLAALEKQVLTEGGFTENLYWARRRARERAGKREEG